MSANISALPAFPRCSSLPRIRGIYFLFIILVNPSSPIVCGQDEEIDLRGRTSFSDREAQEYAERRWTNLFLNDVTDISDQAIALLASHKGGLVLTGIPSVSVAAAQSLSKHEGMLNIGGDTLDDDVVELLAQNRGELGLNRLKSLTRRSAESLAKHHKYILGLNGLVKLPEVVARELAKHRGPIGLTGIESMPEATAAALSCARSRIALTEHRGFSEQARMTLSGHHGRITLSFVDLPQYFPVEEGWIAESDTRADAERARQLIEAATSDALGAESRGDGPFSLSGVGVGMHLRELHGPKAMPNVLENDPTRLLVPAPDDNGDPRPRYPTCVRVDSLSGEIICVEKVFGNTTIDELADAVANTYGKSPQVIEEMVLRWPSQVRKQTSLRYTFPKELLRVMQVDQVGLRGATLHSVVIAVASREWTEQNLRSYGNAVLTACDWARKAIKACNGGDFDCAAIPPLPGTQRNMALNNTHALFVDAHRSELSENTEVAEDPDRGNRRNDINPIVAAVGNVDGAPVIVVCPLNSTVAGIRPLSTLNQFAAHSDIRRMHVADLIKHVANHLVQAEYPPTTDRIGIVREVDMENSRIPFSNRGGVQQLNALFDGTTGARYEWLCEDGWTVRVTFSGTLCFFRKPPNRID